MPGPGGSLQAGRNTEPLSNRQTQQVTATFFSLDREANVRYDAASRTIFRPLNDDQDVNYEIVFGPDIFPGPAVADPNASLSMRCAVAHELTHKARNEDLTEIPEPALEHIDEALTSLGAILRFQDHLSAHEVRQLISDACQRLQLYVNATRAAP